MEKLKDSPGAAGAVAPGGSPGTRSGDGGAVLNPTDTFVRRHLGANEDEVRQMLAAIGVGSLAELVRETVPESIFRAEPLALAGLPADRELGEQELLGELRAIVGRNRVCRSFLGMGYYGCLTPGVIQRNILENPGWYTQYTPYQSEISQGRLEALLNFQTMVADLTGLPVANASLLDEGTAAAEAMNLCHTPGDGEEERLLRRRGLPSADDRGGADPRRGDRHRGPGGRSGGGRLRGRRPLRRPPPVPGDRRPGGRLRSARRAGPRRRRAGGGGDRSAGAHPAAGAGRIRRRHRGRLGAALRRADGLRRSARRLPRHPRRVQAAASRADHRRLARPPRQDRPSAWRCRPASSTSAARRRPATSAPPRCCSPSWPACTPSTTAPRA